MKPPTTEEKVIDDGYGLQFVGKTPEFIKEIMDILKESLDYYINDLEKITEEWDHEEETHQWFIKHLEEVLEQGEPWVNLNDPEAVAKANEDIGKAKAQYVREKQKFEEEKKKDEDNIAIRKAKMAVLEDALRRAQQGPA